MRWQRRWRIGIAAIGMVICGATLAFSQGLYRYDDPYQVLQNNATATGDGTVINIQGWSSITVVVTGITTATVQFQATVDGATWDQIGCARASDGTVFSVVSQNGSFICSVPGYLAFRAPISSYTSGSISVRAVRSTAAALRRGGGGGGGGGGSTVSINGAAEPTPNFLDSLDVAWTNVSGAVRAFFAPTINVKRAPYNAVCDGVTDDRAAIQAAIDAAPNYATIVLDGATGLCAIGASSDPAVRSLRIANKTGITFEGRRGGGFVVLSSVETQGWTHTLMGSRIAFLVESSTRITFRELEFLGNRDGQPLVNAAPLALMQCTGCTVERSVFRRGGGHTPGNVSAQLVVRGGARNTILRNEFYDSNVGASEYARCLFLGDNTNVARIETDSRILHNYIYNCAHSAIVWNGIGGLLEGNTIEYPTTIGWNGSGFSLASYGPGGVTVRELRVVNNYIKGAPYQGIQLYTPNVDEYSTRDTHVVITGNTIIGCNGHGVYLLHAIYTQVSNNIVQDCNEGGIRAFGRGQDVNISDNLIFDSRSGDSRTMLRGIEVYPDGTNANYRDVLIANNRVANMRLNGIVAHTVVDTRTLDHVQIIGNMVRDTVAATGDGAFGDGIAVNGPGVVTNAVVRGNIALGSSRYDFRVGNVASGSTVVVNPDDNIFASTVSGSNVAYASHNTLTVDSSTPSVRFLSLWREANTTATTITDLLDGREGQTIRIYFSSANTTIANNANISLGTGAAFTGQVGDILTLQRVGTVWREVSRSRPPAGTGGSSAFNDITTGTNTSAAMTVGTGSTLTFSGSGVVNASQFHGTSTIALNRGGTNQTSWTANRCVRVNAAGTALESASGDCAAGGGIGGSTGTVDNAVLRADGTGGATLQSSNCTIDDAGVMTCASYVASGPGTGVVTLLEGTAPGAGANAGEHNLYFDSTDSLLKSHENGGSVVTYYSSANQVRIQEWGGDLVGLVGGTASHIWDDDPLSTACTPTAVTGTNQSYAVCTFPDTDGEYGRQLEFDIPPGGITNLSAVIWWRTTGTGNARFRVQTLCYASDAAGDAAYGSNSIYVTAAAGTSGRLVRVAMANIPIDGCDPNERMAVRFSRNRTEASDTLNAALDVRRVRFYAEVKQ